MLALPAVEDLRRLLAIPERKDLRVVFGALLLELAADARERAEHSWRRHKAPMAAYWKAVSVYARHTARAIL